MILFSKHQNIIGSTIGPEICDLLWQNEQTGEWQGGGKEHETSLMITWWCSFFFFFLHIMKHRKSEPLEGHWFIGFNRLQREFSLNKEFKTGPCSVKEESSIMCVPIRRTVYKERSKSYNSSILSSSLSCVIREVRASLFAVNNALEQQSGICHSRATCCSLEAKSFQPLASEHLGKNWGEWGVGEWKRERKEELQSPFLVAIHYISPLVSSSIETVKFFRIKLITKWNWSQTTFCSSAWSAHVFNSLDSCDWCHQRNMLRILPLKKIKK